MKPIREFWLISDRQNSERCLNSQRREPGDSNDLNLEI